MHRFLTAAMAALCLSVSGARADTVEDYYDTSLYPARISAINFENSSISATSSSCWGNWCVRIPSGGVTAEYAKIGLTVVDLTCSNSVAGDKDCGMSLSKEAGCAIWIPGGPPIDIKCPDSLDFAR